MIPLKTYIVTWYDGDAYQTVKFLSLSFADAVEVMETVTDTTDINSIIEISQVPFGTLIFRSWIEGKETEL